MLFAAATPKQIRELMKVDGLTNDEVKSHLQVKSPPHLQGNDLLVLIYRLFLLNGGISKVLDLVMGGVWRIRIRILIGHVSCPDYKQFALPLFFFTLPIILQKYRLHTRRPGPTPIPSTGASQAPQFVVVGGIWVPPPEYAAVVTTTSSGEAAKASVGYAPLGTPPPASFDQKKQSEESEGRGSHSAGGGGAARSNSPSTSSSTHTTTASHLC